MTGTSAAQTPDGPNVDAGLRTQPLPDGYELVETWRLDTTAQLSSLRRDLTLATGRTPGALDQVGERMVLIATELATNALLHGIPPTIVRLFTGAEAYLVDVADHDLGTRPVPAGDRAVGSGGFGLQIARKLSQDVGWYTTETTKHVWALMPLT
ncbi:ATP-binding protein [Cellulomonas oligotrophica]|uniref:Anti-sigma regulatory factor (Ser/Thr protein kinase) n=1 Tax=Cellulomonas oligotrophica TaxID=931536 RepID=A0A7Y9FFS2_9CELL|nr:ATP-binding protein [Cellulomonas oligotrophica]NYD86500.1 anti-sigma regulatory factor (Ser/Thr protein kinase) [Cellulomonas oligotrophica]GIG32609.1 hypothetical protein Col01nite_17680 [Cellulomonas oligotrophica]